MNPIKAIFFDVGATLLTPAEDEGTTFTQIASKIGLSIEATDVTEKVHLMYGLYQQLYEQDESFWSDDIRAKAIWIEMYEYLASLLDIPQHQRRQLAEAVYHYYFSPKAWRLYDDVLPTLEALRTRDFRLALISNWDSSLASIIEGLALTHYFETIISSAEVCLHKPMPEIFQLGLNRLGISAREAVHVGDHVSADADGAARVGITPILLDRDNMHTDFSGLRVSSLIQINELVKR